MGRKFLIGAQLLATFLFISNFNRAANGNLLGWAVPLTMILLIVVNSVWFTRFISWVIFATSFFSMMVVLSAFTLGWRLAHGFSPGPFYRTLLMYTTFVYVSLAQIKILGGGSAVGASPDQSLQGGPT